MLIYALSLLLVKSREVCLMKIPLWSVINTFPSMKQKSDELLIFTVCATGTMPSSLLIVSICYTSEYLPFILSNNEILITEFFTKERSGMSYYILVKSSLVPEEFLSYIHFILFSICAFLVPVNRNSCLFTSISVDPINFKEFIFSKP